MLGKAIKHEFRATGRVMLPLFAVSLFVSLLAHFAVRGLDNTEEINSILLTGMILTMVLFAVGITAVFVVAFVQMIRRFRANILGDEGYLTMTLPVSVHSLIWSKLIVSLVWFLCAGVVMVLSSMIVAVDVTYIQEALNTIGQLFRELLQLEGRQWALAGEGLATLLLWAIATCLSVYAALSVGYGFARHKMLLSILVYILLSTLTGWITTALGGGLVERSFFGYASPAAPVHETLAASLGWSILTAAVHCVIYYVITVWNLKHRLNLE